LAFFTGGLEASVMINSPFRSYCTTRPEKMGRAKNRCKISLTACRLFAIGQSLTNKDRSKGGMAWQKRVL
jgi:hypothetical protein